MWDPVAFMAIVADWPGVQDIPAAIDIEADHAPEAQRWNDLPSVAQSQSPSLEHLVP